MNTSRLAIIIVNWKLKEKTAVCLRSLENLAIHCPIWVVDNGSADGSAAYLAQHFPHIHLIASPENIGFGRACNLAISQALADPACEFVFLLNNDTTIHPQALNELLKVADHNPQAGIFGPKIYLSDQRNVLWYAGARRRRYVLAAADTGRGVRDDGQFNKVREVDFVFGAAMLIRRQLLETTGLFDPQFFVYLEDMDLCLRAQEDGYTLLFVPQAKVWHKGSASTSNNAALRTYHHARSTVLFLKKHTSWLTLLPVLLFWVLVVLRAVLLKLWAGETAVIRAYWSGFIKGVRELYR